MPAKAAANAMFSGQGKTLNVDRQKVPGPGGSTVDLPGHGNVSLFLVNQKEMVNQKRIGFTKKKTKSKTRSKMNKTYLGDILHGFRPAIYLFLRYPESASC